jgi:hypothetical protein
LRQKRKAITKKIYGDGAITKKKFSGDGAITKFFFSGDGAITKKNILLVMVPSPKKIFFW